MFYKLKSLKELKRWSGVLKKKKESSQKNQILLLYRKISVLKLIDMIGKNA
jgi:hypothetical protein